MRVTFYEVTRLCFVVFRPVCLCALLVSQVYSKQRWKRHIYVFYSTYMWICCQEDVVWKFFSGECRTTGVGALFFWGSASFQGSGGESDLILYPPAHVSHHVVNSLHQPRFNKDSFPLRWQLKGTRWAWKTSAPLPWAKLTENSNKSLLGVVT